MSEKKVLVTVQEIGAVRKHTNADQLIVATIQGYEVIIRPESFGESIDTMQNLVGKKGVLFYIDSVIPVEFENLSLFSFLSRSHMGRRVKTLKLRKEYSQGLFISFSDLETQGVVSLSSDLPVGTDLTELLKVVKYCDPSDTEAIAKPINLDSCYRPFPSWFPKTNQNRLQENVYFLERFADRQFVTTLKVDGQSATFYCNPDQKEVGMCSRNYKLIPNDTIPRPAQFDAINSKYKLEEQLALVNRRMAIQGEIYGLGINGNRLKMTNIDFVVFDIYEWDENGVGGYLPHSEVQTWCDLFRLRLVPVVEPPKLLSELPKTISDWVQFAEKQTYDSLSKEKGLLAEGLVVKSCDNLKPYVSFKIISRAFLEKYGL